MSSNFKLEAFLNPNMGQGATTVRVVFTASGDASAVGAKAKLVFGFIIDDSGSMREAASSRSRGSKMESAKHAARVAVQALPESTEFFVIGLNKGIVVSRRLANAEAKRAAHGAIQQMEADGGTFISRAIVAARQQFGGASGAIGIGVLLTDGDNDGGDMRALNAEVQASRGLFQVHCRGFGTDWKRAKLQPISDALMGTIGLVAEADALESDFMSILSSAAGKGLRDLRLRIWMPKIVQLAKIKQMFPTEVELTQQIPVDQRSIDIPLGAWGQDSQDYQATFSTTARDADGTNAAICRPSLVYTDPTTGQLVEVAAEVNYDPEPVWGEKRPGVVEAAWTDDVSLTMRVNRVLSHQDGESEKGEAQREFAEAWDKGDEATATVRLQRVLELAEQSGDEDTKRMVRSVAEVDQGTGTVTLRRRGQVDKASVMDIEVASQRTVRARRG